MNDLFSFSFLFVKIIVILTQLHQESSSMVIPGIAQLKQKPTQSNLAIPPSKRSPPPKIKIYRTETNV